MAKADLEKYSEWRVSDAVNTLTNAEELKQDPKMMGLVRTEISKKQAALTAAVADVKVATKTPTPKKVAPKSVAPKGAKKSAKR